jgi:ribose-phosphate pyrophosphokinase
MTKFKRVRYPDGQVSAIIQDWDHSPTQHIKERMNSYEDLMFIVGCADAARSIGSMYVHLDIPCMFGQRSDRRFSFDQSFDLRHITAVINAANFYTVRVFDPHSSVSISLLDRSVAIPPDEYVERTIKALDTPDLVLVSPDAGAYKKVFDYAERFNTPLVASVKHRSKVGEVHLEFFGDVIGKPCLIVDDLADGGYTFHLLAEALKAKGASHVYLYVSHGMFFKGFDLLKQNIDRIFCTNSYRDINDPFVSQFKVI